MQPDQEHHRLYRAAWRWRALCAAIAAFPAGWFIDGWMDARTEMLPSGLTPPVSSGGSHFTGSLLASVTCALFTLSLARAKNPQAYWPFTRTKKPAHSP